MSKIFGHYILRAHLDDFFTPYNLTSNNRNAEVVGSADEELLFSLSFDSYRGPLITSVKFLTQVKLKINRVRILTPGCPGLQPSPGKSAAVLFLRSKDGTNGGSEIFLEIPKFNEWCEIGLEYETFSDLTEKYYWLDLEYENGSTKLNIDDYNIQAAYIGQPLKTVLEIEVDTAGLYNGYEVI